MRNCKLKKKKMIKKMIKIKRKKRIRKKKLPKRMTQHFLIK